MSQADNVRVYSFRHPAKCTKYLSNGSESIKSPLNRTPSETQCKNCTALSVEIDRLQRQLANLNRQIVVQSPGSNEFDQFSVNSTVYNQKAADSPSQNTVESQTESDIHYDVCCGTDQVKTNDIACGRDKICELHTIDGTDHVIRPYDEHNLSVFKDFDVNLLDKCTKYSHHFGNRFVAYYGQYPYTYTGGSHVPMSALENQYLKSILNAIDKQYPSFSYNSAMITRYSDGSEWIPPHSDDEDCIAPNSTIMTISFGQKRTLQFESIMNTNMQENVTVRHGDVVTMSQLSQSHFKHSVPVDNDCKNLRISITLRKILPPTSNVGPSVTCPKPDKGTCSQTKHYNKPISDPHPRDKPITVYISSSMFSQLDAAKLSSKSQEAHVFSYPGATADGINQRFHSDDRKNLINTSDIKKIVLMCGTNDVDLILNSPKHLRTKLLKVDGHKANAKCLDSANRNIENLVLKLHEWAPHAMVSIVNILPRESCVRNEVICDINHFISSLSCTYSYVNMIDTEKDRYLFVNQFGFRKSAKFFSNRGEDNVHLNPKGVIRLAKHLKYHAHL